MDYPYRPLIGLIEATTTPVAEREFHDFLPPGVWLSTCRVPFIELSQSGLSDMMKNIIQLTDLISVTPMDLLVVLSMTGTCLRGQEMRNTLQQRLGVPTITAAQTVLDVLKKRLWKRLLIVSNFNPELTFVERVFFNSHDVDVEVLSTREERTITGQEVIDTGMLDNKKLLDKLEQRDFSKVDALFFDAPFFNINDIYSQIEERANRPVLTMNQVILDVGLKMLGQPTDHLLVSKYLD